jgi:hypothetical protein
MGADPLHHRDPRLTRRPVMAMPVDPTPAAPTVLEGQFISAAYGHYRRVGRHTVRRAYRRGYYGGGYGYKACLLWQRLRAKLIARHDARGDGDILIIGY